MDTGTIDRDGLNGLSDDLAMINAIQSRSDLATATIVLLRHGPGETGTGPLYSYSAEVNPRNSTEMVSVFVQGGLGMPDRDYYLKDDPKSVELRQKYVAHVARMFELAGQDPATGLYDICPECGGASLAYEEGCKKCYACGYSEC